MSSAVRRYRLALGLFVFLLLAMFAVALPAYADEGGAGDASSNATYSCMIGSTGYEHVADAANAVKKGETIKMVSDYTIPSSGSYKKSITFDGKKDVTLDLNGYKIDAGDSFVAVIHVDGGSVTIDDTSAAQTGEIYQKNYKELETLDEMAVNILLTGGCTFVLNGGYIHNDAGMLGTAILSNSASYLTVNGGTIETRNAYNFDPWSYTNYCGAIYLNYLGNWHNTTTTINGGRFIRGGIFCIDGVFTDGNVYVNGGTFETWQDPRDVELVDLGDQWKNPKLKNNHITMTGGTFAHLVPDCQLAKGYVNVMYPDGTYHVEKKDESQYLCKITGVSGTQTMYSKTLEGALAITSGCTITLLDDTTCGPVSLGTARYGSCVLDLNGHTVTALGDSDGVWLTQKGVWGTLEVKGGGCIKSASGDTGATTLFHLVVDANFKCSEYVDFVSNKTIFQVWRMANLDISNGRYEAALVDGVSHLIEYDDLSQFEGWRTVITGGTFINFNPQQAENLSNYNLLLDGYGASRTTSGSNYVYGVYKGVAQFVYSSGDAAVSSSLDSAVKFAADHPGSTVRLLTDASIYGVTTWSGLNDVTLDLFGKSITRYLSYPAWETDGIVLQDSSLTVTDTTVDAAGKISSSCGNPLKLSNSTLTLKNGTIYMNGTSEALALTNGSTANIEGGTLNGGTGITASGNGQTLNITGGSVQGFNRAVEAEGTGDALNVTGGLFETRNSYAKQEFAVNADATKFITGGTFTHEVPKVQLAAGYRCEQNAEGLWEVKQGDWVATITNEATGEVAYFATLDDAIAAAQKNDIIVLISDITLDEPADFSGKIIDLDINGHTLTSAASCTIYGSGNDGMLGIRDSLTCGKIENTFADAISVENGFWLGLDGGAAIEGAQSGIAVDSEARVNSTIATIAGTQQGIYVAPGAKCEVYVSASTTLSGGQALVYKDANAESKIVVSQAPVVSATSDAATVDMLVTGDAAASVVSVGSGTFSHEVPLEQCADGYIPITKEGSPTTYSVTKGWIVTFDANGGTLTGDEMAYVQAGQKLAKPADPTRNGYDFTGWYTDEACTSAFDFDAAPTANTTLYAGWNQVQPTITHMVTFDLNYEGSTPTTETIEDGKTVAAPSDPVREGYGFNGWFDEATGGDAFNFDEPITDNVTIYAQWTEQVAQIKETGAYYGSLQEAVDAAADGQTVVVCKDVTLTSQLSLSDKGITLDLSGKAVSADADTVESAVYVSDGSLTIQDTSDGATGTITGGTCAVRLADVGTFEMKSGNLYSQFATVWAVNSDASVGTVKIGGGNVRAGTADQYGYVGLWLGGNVSMDVSGGAIEGQGYAVFAADAQGTHAISGGTLTGNNDQKTTVVADDGAAGFVTGGLFNKPVPLAQCAEGYYPATVTDESGATRYTVKQGELAASVTAADGTVAYFDSLDAAIDAVSEGCTLALMKDIETSDTTYVPTNYAFTFDLNGHTLKSTADVALQLDAAAAVTIDDSEGEGAISAPSTAVKSANGASLTVKNGNLVSTSEAGGSAIWATTGSVNIEGGFVYSTGGNGVYLSGNSATLNIMGGTICGTQAVLVKDASNFLYVDGGFLVSSDEATVDIQVPDGVGGFVRGGMFTCPVPKAQCAEGFIPYTVMEGIYTVTEGYTLTFDANGGELTGDAEQAVAKGETTTQPSDPTRDGYTFSGWTTDKEGTAAFIFGEELTANTTVYAQWGETTKVASVTTQAGETTYYDSIEEAVAAAPEGATVQLLVSVETEEPIIASDGKNIVLDLNGRTLSSESASAVSVDGASLVICDSSEDGTGKVRSDSGCALTMGSAANVTVEGGLLAGEYAINNSDASNNLTINGGKFAGTKGVEYPDIYVPESGGGFVTGGVFVHEVPADQCADGYVPAANTDESTKDSFPYTVAKGSEPPEPEKTKVEKPDMTPIEGLVYNAQTQTGVNVDANDYYTVEGATATDAGTYTVKVSLKDKENTCWADGSTDDLTVEWTIVPKPVTVTVHDANTVAPSPLPNIKCDVAGAIEGTGFNAVPKEAANADFNTPGTYGITAICVGDENYDVTVVPGTLTVYEDKADHEAKQCTVTFQPEGGVLAEGSAVQYVDYEAAVVEPAKPTREGYVFAGWVNEFGEQWDFSTGLHASMELFATWTRDATVVDIPKPEIAPVTYNGQSQKGYSIDGSEHYKLAGETEATGAGVYMFTVKLEPGCVWADGTTDDIDFYWLIAPADVTVTVDSKSMVAGDEVPELTGSIAGVVEGDDLGVKYALAEGADTTKPGTYGITATYADDPNYDVVVVEGELTVTKKEDPTPPTPPIPTPDPDPQPTPDPGVNPGSGDSGNGSGGSIAATGDTTLPIAAVAGGCVIVAGAAVAFALRKRRR